MQAINWIITGMHIWHKAVIVRYWSSSIKKGQGNHTRHRNEYHWENKSIVLNCYQEFQTRIWAFTGNYQDYGNIKVKLILRISVKE